MTVTFRGLVLLAEVSAARATSPKSIFETLLLWFKSLKPSGPPSLLAKNTSSVSGNQIGASCAKAKPGFDATTRIEAEVPKIFVTKSEWKTWKKGGEVLVGLKSWVVDELRNGPFSPSTAKD